MKIFNAKLDILSSAPITINTWAVSANIIDNSGQFMASDIALKDIVYCIAVNSSFENIISRFKVTTINTASGAFVDLILTWDEPSTNYADPQTGVDCIIGRPLPGGVTCITSTSNGVGADIIQAARNIDLNLASFNAMVDMTPTPLSSTGGVVTLPPTGSCLFLVNGTENITSIVGREKGAFTIIWNFSRNIIYNANQLEPNKLEDRLLGQGEITSFVFVGSCVKETSQPGGNFVIDGGGF